GCSQLPQRLEESRAVVAANGVGDLPRPADRLEPSCHGQNGRDTDPAGDQHAVSGAFEQGKVVSWWTDLEHIADGELLVHPARAAATVRIVVDANHIAVAFVLAVQERVAAHDAFGHPYVDVCAGCEGRQGLAIDGTQFDGAHVLRLV